MVFQHGFNRVTQQRGVVARKWRNNQHCGLALEFGQRVGIVGKALEAAQLAKRFVDFNPLVNRHAGAVNINRLDAKSWLFVVFTQAVQQAVTGCHALGKRVLTHGRQWVAVNF